MHGLATFIIPLVIEKLKILTARMTMKPKSSRKNLLCLAKTVPKALKELLVIRDNATVLDEQIDGFADYENACKFMKKKKCGLLATNTKNQLVFMRTCNYQPLEILKFRIIKSLSSADFKTLAAEFYSKYFVICQGVTNKRIENLFVDLLCQKAMKVNIDAIRYAWILSEGVSDGNDIIYTLKYVRVLTDLSVEDIGPYFELILENEFYCGDELYGKAFAAKQPKKQKNITSNVFKDTVGRLYVDRQDLNNIRLKKSRAYRKANGEV